jgi:predicted nucleic acid-binding protein
MSHTADDADLISIVLADANVLYSRVLRDYVLYAADQEIISISWSSQILSEATEHLMQNVEGFDHAAARRLVDAMNRAFPLAEVEPAEEHWLPLRGLALPDEHDRHVLAASLAAEATVLCTSNIKDFPPRITDALGFEVLTPDQLLGRLAVEYPEQMLAVHHTSAASLKGATVESTITALRRAGAPATADIIARLLGDAGIKPGPLLTSGQSDRTAHDN